MRIHLISFALLAMFLPRDVAIAVDVKAPAAIQTAPAGRVSSATADDLFNRAIHNADDEFIGYVCDVLVVPSHDKVASIIVDVGGYLQSTEKHVRLPADTMALVSERDRNRLVVDVSRRSLEEAAAFRFDADSSEWVAVIRH